MSLRHAVLGLLARRPSTGYELTRTFDRSLRTSWHARHSQIYPELAKLEAAELVEVVGRGARRSKTYDLTPAGREELRRWLCEATPDRSQRNESSLRLFLTPLLEPSDREATYRRDLVQVEEDLAMLSALRDGADDAADPEAFAPQVELGIRINGVLKDWLVEQIASASANGDGTASGLGGVDR